MMLMRKKKIWTQTTQFYTILSNTSPHKRCVAQHNTTQHNTTLHCTILQYTTQHMHTLYIESWASWSCFLSYSCLATSRASRINAAFFLTSSRAHRVRVSWNSSIFSSIRGVEKKAWRHEVMMWRCDKIKEQTIKYENHAG